MPPSLDERMPHDERRIRRVLPVLRLLLAYVPLLTLRRLQSFGARREWRFRGIAQRFITADGVACEWLIPLDSADERVLVYLHGGGFVFGWTDMHRRMVIRLAQEIGARALAVDYRLAPEHPFPAALDDCATVYRWLLKQGYKPENIAIAGDSAGGNLTLTTLIKLRDDGDPLPAGAACLSPATDLYDEARLEGVRDPVLHPRVMRGFRDAYIPNHDPRHPLLSPVYADLHGLPPLLIHAGEDEALRDHAERIAEAAQKAGVAVRLHIYPRMWHVWQLSFAYLAQGAQSLTEIGQFLRAQMDAPEKAAEPPGI